jgi:hypothetical protein
MPRGIPGCFIGPKDKLEKCREIRPGNKNYRWIVAHYPAYCDCRASRGQIRKENIDAESTCPRAQPGFDVFTAQIRIREREKDISKAGDLLDGADYSLGKRAMAGDNRAWPAIFRCPFFSARR